MYRGNQNGYLMSILIQETGRNNDKIEYKHHEDLSDIDEEDEKNCDNNSYKIFYPETENVVQDKSSRYSEHKDYNEILPDPTKFYNGINNKEKDKRSLRIHSLFETNNLKRMLSNRNSKENKSLPTKLLYKNATLSSMIESDQNNDASCRHIHPHLKTTIIPYKAPCFASSQLEFSLSMNKDSIVLGKLSSASLNQSKCYFNCSTNSSSNNFLFNKVHKSHKSNSLIAKTKSRISLLESNGFYHSEPCPFPNNPLHSQQSFRLKIKEKSINKSQISSKFFNQNFKLNFSEL